MLYFMLTIYNYYYKKIKFMSTTRRQTNWVYLQHK